MNKRWGSLVSTVLIQTAILVVFLVVAESHHIKPVNAMLVSQLDVVTPTLAALEPPSGTTDVNTSTVRLYQRAP